MTIAALITEGIGPGGTIPFLLTGGLDLGVVPPTPTTRGGHWLPHLSKKQIRKLEREAAAIEAAREAEWARRKAEINLLARQIEESMHPERILGDIAVPEPMFEDDDETDIEMLLLYG